MPKLGNLLTTLYNFGEEFTIQFEMKIYAPPTGVASVIHFAANNESSIDSRVPAIFLAPSSVQLQIKFASIFLHQKDLSINKTYWIEISKTPQGNNVKISNYKFM